MKKPEITPWNVLHIYFAGCVWVMMMLIWIVMNIQLYTWVAGL